MTAYANMYSTSSYLLSWAARLLSVVLFLNVPSEFWTQVLSVLDFPDEVKIAIAPFFGSACATAVEYLAAPKETDQKPWHWPLKLFVGWMAGAYGGGSADVVFKGSPETLAFWGGVLGYGSIALVLYNQKRKLHDPTDSDDHAA